MSRRFRDLHTPTSDTSGPPRQEALLVDIDTVYDQDPGDDLLFPEYQRDKSPTPALLTVETQAVKNTTRPQVLGLVRDHESPCSVLDDNDDNNPDRDGADDDDDPFSYLDELEDSAQESRDALAALGSALNPISVVSSPPRAAPDVALDEGGENDNRVFFRVDHVKWVSHHSAENCDSSRRGGGLTWSGLNRQVMARRLRSINALCRRKQLSPCPQPIPHSSPRRQLRPKETRSPASAGPAARLETLPNCHNRKATS